MIETVQGVAYGRPATDALAARIVSIQAGDPLAPVTVVVPSNAAGLAARRVLGAASGLANVSFLTPFAVAERLGRPRTAAAGHAQLTEPILIAAIRRELRADAGFFDPVSTHVGTERALAQRYAELSRARPETVERIGRSGSARARALVDLCRRVRNRLDAYADEDALARAAHAAVAEGDATSAGLGSLILFLPQPVPPGLRDLMVSVMAARPTTALVGLTGDPEADGPVREECARLELHLGDSAGIEISTGTEVITASDADDEVRAVVRRILALAESGIPFDRMAILFPPVEPYARIVAAQLATAGIVRNGPSVRTLADSMPGRMLDRLLRLVGAAFARNELVALFASTPVRTPEGGAVPIDRWDRISRRAGVVDGDGW